MRGIESVRKNASGAAVDDQTGDGAAKKTAAKKTAAKKTTVRKSTARTSASSST